MFQTMTFVTFSRQLTNSTADGTYSSNSTSSPPPLPSSDDKDNGTQSYLFYVGVAAACCLVGLLVWRRNRSRDEAAPDLEAPHAPPPQKARRRSSFEFYDQASKEANRNAAVKERMVKPLEEWTEEDGEALGEELYDSVQQDKADKVKLLSLINEILGKYGTAMKEFIMANPLVIWILFATLEFGAMQLPGKRNGQGKKKKQKLARERRRNHKASVVALLDRGGGGGSRKEADDNAVTPTEQERKAKTDKRGKELGVALRMSLISNLLYRTGVMEWVVQNPEVADLFSSDPFFKAMMLAIAKKIAVGSNTGMKYRLGVATWLTYMDVSSDLYMMRKYFLEGRMGTFYACLAIMIVHTFVQLILCFVQNRRNKKYMAKEMALILIFVKPIVDLMRLIRNDPKQPHQMLDGLNEMMASKQIEAVFEAFPQTLVQYVALISDILNGEVNIVPIMSILTSALTAAYAQAVIGYDADIDPDRREKGGLIYGYVPDSRARRVLVIVFSTLFGACQLLIRCFSLGLHYIKVGGKETMRVMAVEVAVMLVGVPLVQGTLYTWLPLDGPVAVIVSGLVCLCPYVATSSSPFLQFRHPYDLGGRLFTCTMLLAIASSWLMVWRVNTFDDSEPSRPDETSELNFGGSRNPGHPALRVLGLLNHPPLAQLGRLLPLRQQEPLADVLVDEERPGVQHQGLLDGQARQQKVGSHRRPQGLPAPCRGDGRVGEERVEGVGGEEAEVVRREQGPTPGLPVSGIDYHFFQWNLSQRIESSSEH